MSCDMWRNMRCNDVPFAIIIVVHEEERTIEVFFDSIMLDEIFSVHGKDAVYFLTGYNTEEVEKVAKRKATVKPKEETFFGLNLYDRKKVIYNYHTKEKGKFDCYTNNNLDKEDVIRQLYSVLHVFKEINHKKNEFIRGEGFDELYSAIKRIWNS